MVTALLGYLNMLFMISVLEYLDYCHANFTKFQFLGIYFSKISPIKKIGMPISTI